MLLPVHTSHGLPDDSAAADDQSSSVWQSKLTRQHMVLIWTFGMVASFIDEALPLYCMMFLAMGEVEIGRVLSIAEIFFASLQYLVFSTITQRLGSQRAIWMGAMFGSLPTVFFAFAGAWDDGKLWLASILTILKLFHSTFFTNMAMSVNKTVDTSRRAKLNALIMTGNSVGRGLGPSLAGMAVTLSVHWSKSNITVASALIWGPIPLLFGLIVSRKSYALATLLKNQDSSS